MTFGVFLVVAPIVFLMAAFASLGVVYPQLAFRISNIFQLRSVELSTFGLIIHKAGGIFAIIFVFVMSLNFASLTLVVATILGAALPPLYFYINDGRFIVQGIDGRVH